MPIRLGVYREEKDASVRSDDSDDDGPILYREDENLDEEGKYFSIRNHESRRNVKVL